MKFRRLLAIWICGLLLWLYALPLMAWAAPVSSDGKGMTPLSDLSPLNGQWEMGAVIRSSGSGDCFALSSVSASDVVLEADVRFIRHSGAASLIFISPDDPSSGAYCANIDLSAGNARIFRFRTGGADTLGEYVLPQEVRSRDDFHLRVEVKGGDILYFLDGDLIIAAEAKQKTPGLAGRLGLLTYNTEVEYENVRYGLIENSSPALTSLTAAGAEMNAAFDGGLQAECTIPFGQKQIVLHTAHTGDRLTVEPLGGTDIVVSSAAKGDEFEITGFNSDFSLLLTVQKEDFMIHYLFSAALEADPADLYNEPYRPQFHFSPLVNWLNDPNGLVYDPAGGRYHLYYQYNPYGLNIANQVWAHAESSDLIHWKQIGIAIDQDSLGAVFSGSAVVDEDNTSGFFTDNTPEQSKLVAFFTSDGGDTTHGVEKQCIAYSKDFGRTWIRPSIEVNGFENPVISNAGEPYGRDFRDPKVFRYDGKWFMAVAGGRARLFTSDDLIHWTMVCDMGFDSECPDFYPLSVDGDESNIKWVYTASGKWYVVGRLEKGELKEGVQTWRFVAETERKPYNGGSEVYATQSYYNDGSGENRRIAISWLQDYTAPGLAGKTWNGAMSLPHQQTLRTVNGKLVLTSYPVAESEALRGSKLIDLVSPSVEEAAEALRGAPGSVYELLVSFTPDLDAVFCLKLRCGEGQYTLVSYDRAANRLTVDRSQSGSAVSGVWQSELYPDADGKVSLRILVDTSVIEVFGNEGEAAISGHFFPDADSIQSDCYTDGEGAVTIHSLTLYRLKSIWHDSEVIPETGIYISAQAVSAGIGEPVSLSAVAVNADGSISGQIVWSGLDSDLISVKANENGMLTLIGKEKGEITLTAKAGEAEKQITLTFSDYHFDTDLSGWSSKGDWQIGFDGYELKGASGDSFAFSDRTEAVFTYSGTARLPASGSCLGLVFGVDTPDAPSSGTWYGANVDTYSGKAVAKLFRNQKGSEVWQLTAEIPLAKDGIYRLSVTVSEDKTITYTVNGIQIGEKKDRSYQAGRLGLVAWNGGGSFDQVSCTLSDFPEEDEQTPSVTGEMSAGQQTEAAGEAGSENRVAKAVSKRGILLAVGGVLLAAAVGGVVWRIHRKKIK